MSNTVSGVISAPVAASATPSTPVQTTVPLEPTAAEQPGPPALIASSSTRWLFALMTVLLLVVGTVLVVGFEAGLATGLPQAPSKSTIANRAPQYRRRKSPCPSD